MMRAGFVLAVIFNLLSIGYAQVSFNHFISSNRGHPNLGCAADTVFLSAYVPSPYDTFMWQTVPNIFFAGSVTDTFFILSGVGNVRILLIAIDTNTNPHDTVYVSKTIEIITRPSTYISVEPSTAICPGTPIHFRGQLGRVDSFFWKIDGNYIRNGQAEIVYVYNNIGVDTVTLTASNVCGSNSYSVVINIDTNATPPVFGFIATPSLVCPGTPVKFRTSYTKPRNFTIRWNFGDGSPDIIGNIEDYYNVSHVYSSIGTYTATTVVKWRNPQCTDDSSVYSTNINVVSSALPPVNILTTPGDSVCPGTPMTFTTNLGTDPNIGYFEWDMGDGHKYFSTPINPSIYHTYDTPGTYTISLNVVSQCGAATTVNKTIKVKQSGISVTTTIQTPPYFVCPNSQFPLIISTDMPVDSIVVIFGNFVYSSGPDTREVILTAPSSLGEFPITVKVLNKCGEWFTYEDTLLFRHPGQNLTLNINPQPSSNTCVGDTITFQIFTFPRIPIDTLIINFGDGTIDTLILDSTTTDIYVSHAFSSEGNYMLQAIAKNNCFNLEISGYKYLHIKPIEPFATLQLNPNILCAGDTTQLELYFPAPSLIPAPYQVTWDLGDGTTDTGTIITHSYNNSGIYYITAFLHTCFGTDTFTDRVTVLSTPLYEIIASDTFVCEASTVTLSANLINNSPASQLLWSFSDGTIDTGQTINKVFNNTGIITVLLFAIGDTCTSMSSFDIHVFKNIPPNANFSYNYQGNGLTTFNNLSQNASSFLWDFGDGTTSTDPNPTHTYTANGTYTITLIASNPCGLTDTFSQTITITDLTTIDVNSPISNSTILIFPNPTLKSIVVKSDISENATLIFTLKDLSGKTILQTNLQENLSHINLETIPQGTYIGTITNTENNSTIWQRKIIKGQ